MRAASDRRTSRLTTERRVSEAGSAARSLAVTGVVSAWRRHVGATARAVAAVFFRHGTPVVADPLTAATDGLATAAGRPRRARASTDSAARWNSLTRIPLHAWF